MPLDKVDNGQQQSEQLKEQKQIQLDFSKIEQIYKQPLDQKTKYVFDMIFAYEFSHDNAEPKAQAIVEKLARYCARKNIPQEKIKSIKGDDFFPLSNELNRSECKTFLEEQDNQVNKNASVESQRIGGKKEQLEAELAAEDKRIQQGQEDFAAQKKEEGKLNQDLVAEKNKLSTEKEDLADEVSKLNVEKQELKEIKHQLENVAKLQIEPTKFRKYLLPEKDQGKLKNTSLGEISNETYAKLRYLVEEKNENAQIINEKGQEVTVAVYRGNFIQQYGLSISATLQQVNEELKLDIMTIENKNVLEPTKEDLATDRKLDTTTEMKFSGKSEETGKQWNANGFNNTFSRLRGEFRSGDSKFDDVLDKKIGEVLSKDWLEKDRGELGNIGLAWGEELKSEMREARRNDGKNSPEENAKWEIRKNNEVIKNMSRAKIYAVIEGIVASEEDRAKYADLLLEYISTTYTNATREKHPSIQPRAEFMLNMLFKKSFQLYTRMIMKNQIAEQYFGKVSDMLSAGGQKMILKEEKNAIIYDEDGGMKIKYHTAQAPGLEGEIIIDANGKVSITDMMGIDGQNKKNELKKTSRVLPGRLIPVNEMVLKLKDDKQTFAQQWHDRVLASDPNKYKDGDYTRALKGRVKSILDYDPNELHSEDVMRAGMRHTLESTRSFDTLARLQNTFQTNPPQITEFMRYYNGQTNSIPNKLEYNSLFMIRDMCVGESANTIQKFDESVQKLITTYSGISKEQNPFLQQYANDNIWKLFGYFISSEKGMPSFSMEYFEKFVNKVTIDRPSDIEQWLNKNFVDTLPRGTKKFRESEEKLKNTDAEGYMDSQINNIPSAPGGGKRLESSQPAFA